MERGGEGGVERGEGGGVEGRGGGEEHSGDIVCDLAPISNRLMLFYSDFRCPHEVLPVTAGERYAVTLWYMDGRGSTGLNE